MIVVATALGEASSKEVVRPRHFPRPHHSKHEVAGNGFACVRPSLVRTYGEDSSETGWGCGAIVMSLLQQQQLLLQ